jgi:hypothetical protein
MLTQKNLLALQEQLQPPTFSIAREKVLAPDDPQYPDALHERGCFLLTLSDESSPSNYETIQDVLNTPRSIPMSLEKATEWWNIMEEATSETMVSWVITSGILNCVAMQQPGQDL